MFTGPLSKMRTTLADTVQYQLGLGEENVDLNALLNEEINIEFTGQINCIQCNRQTKKSFQSGYCYPCFRRIGECNNCMIMPERCLHGTGDCKPDDWVHANCMAPHIVYLANSSDLKVGVTRATQVPTRWIDQGAVQALPIFETKSRYLAGIIEVAMKPFVADKTNWRKMLKNDVQLLDLHTERDQLFKVAASELAGLQEKHTSDMSRLTDQAAVTIQYPVTEYPTTIKSFNLDKAPHVKGKLQGIKGQYLLLDTGVINIRKFGGYEVRFQS